MKYIKRIIVALCLLITSITRADEGMWLPLFLQQMNEQQMKGMGMKISARDIYDINKGSLKDAIVSFGGFCTGEVVSSKGLLLTNHHCGFGAIQDHSTLEHNYIRDGFWARNSAEEIPNPGLFVTFIIRIEDVSKQALKDVTTEMNESERQSIVDRNIAEIRKNIKKENYQDNFIRPFFEGNQYFLFVTETYKDVRLVGAPPSSIGNFGQDSDNWMWPRHTGDFSLFRIYAGKDNKPAAYSPDNIPYTPKKSLSISLDGVSENDFTMVFGFPGRTMQYLHSAAVDQTVRVNDPLKISIRDKALAVIGGYMRKDEQIKIHYASKYASISNAWKKWQGEVLGLTQTKAVDKKKAYEAEFQKRVNADAELKNKYENILGELAAAYATLEPLSKARDYYTEIISRIELFTIAAQVRNLVNARGKANFADVLARTKERLGDLYKEYNQEVDKSLFAALMQLYYEGLGKENLPENFVTQVQANNHDFAKLASGLFTQSDLDEEKKIMPLLETAVETLLDKINEDPAYDLYQKIVEDFSVRYSGAINEVQAKINRLQRTYMQAQMDVFKEKKFYPDANSTLRITYGKVKGYNPRDAVTYDYYTYLDGVMDKYKPGDYEFDVPAKLIQLYKAKDFGQYGTKDKSGTHRMPVCFIAQNHTTGGNSGSPALDAYGNLVGINFDRVWEGTMSDINYDPSICRNIMVDIRYVLFVIDKYAGAGHLVKEMKLVNPKKGK